MRFFTFHFVGKARVPPLEWTLTNSNVFQPNKIVFGILAYCINCEHDPSLKCQTRQEIVASNTNKSYSFSGPLMPLLIR